MSQQILRFTENVDTIVWDWNGTLLNDLDVVRQTEALHFPNYGIEAPSPEKRAELFCFPVQTYYERLGFDFSRHAYADAHKNFMDIYETCVAEAPLFPGTEDLLNEISLRGKKQFILSAASQSHLESILLKRGLSSYFSGVYGLADSEAASKLARGWELQREHQLDPPRTLLIGDTDHDHEVATKLGFQLLLIADGHKSFETLSALHSQVLATRYLR